MICSKFLSVCQLCETQGCMIASDSHSQIMGMDFFIRFPFLNYEDAFFSFPSRSRNLGMDFFHSLPVPEIREWIFSIPFPFPN